jgi:tRNA (Thr-GGU) A37 N-methylase
MPQTFVLTPVGHVRGGRSDIVDDDWGASRARIELDPSRFKSDALAGLADFSHIDVIFLFDRVPDDKIEYGARRPRGRPDWPLVGIFAQRGKNRPNRLGLCSCRILRIDGLAVEVEGLDAVDGTPVLDLKPVMSGFLPRGDIREPVWAHEIMQSYW